MPAKNTVKQYTEDTSYHVYNRGVEKRKIFLDEQDYSVFLNLLKRHLSKEDQVDGRGIIYESYAGRIELQAFCLMPNHYHLLLYLNKDIKAITELMRRVGGTYTSYFNKKYDRVGPLFQSVFKASRIDSDPYLLHISRYIHRNPKDYYNWQYSSLPYYIKGYQADWVVPDKIYTLYDWGTYEVFLNDHEGFDSTKEELFGVLAHKGLINNTQSDLNNK
jgi:putative transposase